MLARFLARAAILATVCWRGLAAAGTCESLTGTNLDGAQVTVAVSVPGPTYTASDGIAYDVPPFCKVSAVATPTPDSLINIEVWLPASGTWNGRFEGVGSGGYGGSLAVGAPAMVVALRRQFAVASTDMGTVPSAPNNGDALVGHPQK